MSKKTVTKNDPWAPAQPFILQGLQNSGRVFDAQQPQLEKFAAMQRDSYGRLAPGAEAGIAGSQSLVNDTIGGKYLNANPYIDEMVRNSAEDVTNGVNSQFTSAGRYGSGAHAGVLAREIGKVSTGIRGQQYDNERTRQIGALGTSQDLMRGSQSLLNNAAALPWDGVSALNGNVRQASSGYGTTTQTTNDPWGTAVGLAGAGASAYGAWKSGTYTSDMRIKSDITQVGQRPDGLGIYSYMKEGQPEVGVLAQEVEQKRPDAVGPTMPDGTKTANYPALGMAGPLTLSMQDAPDMAGRMAAGGGGHVTVDPRAIPDAQLKRPGFLDRLVNPDASTTAGKIGILGQYLMAASPQFEGFGRGLIGARKEAHDQTELDAKTHEDALDHASRRNLEEAQAVYYGQRGENAGTTSNMRDFEYWRGLPEGPEKDRIGLALRGAGYTPPVMEARNTAQLGMIGARRDASIATQTAGAAARAKYRAPPRGRSAPPKYRITADGQAMKWVP